eukprot:SAG31_NODE_9889_length_1215_cov_1.294803_2_plen_300_part_00
MLFLCPSSLLTGWCSCRIRFNDANFWDEVEAAAAAAEGRRSDAGGITAAVIAELPVSNYTEEDAAGAASAGEDADFSEASTCAICMEEYEAGNELISLPNCGHRFHRDCLAAWLDKNNSCPNCRVVAVEFPDPLSGARPGGDTEGRPSGDNTAQGAENAHIEARELFRRGGGFGGSAHDVIQAATILLNQMTAAARHYQIPQAGAETMDRGGGPNDGEEEETHELAEPEAERLGDNGRTLHAEDLSHHAAPDDSANGDSGVVENPLGLTEATVGTERNRVATTPSTQTPQTAAMVEDIV